MVSLHDIVGVGACEACRGRVTRCLTERPTCSECSKRGTHCKYVAPRSDRYNPAASGSLSDPMNQMSQEAVDRTVMNLGELSQVVPSPVHEGMDEVHQVSTALGVDPHLTRVAAYPPQHMTSRAIKDFFQGTGSLLYLWDREESLKLVHSVYHPKSDSTPVQATEVFAMSAVGSCCDGRTGTAPFQARFIHLFLHMLSTTSDIGDLRRMRLFASLAICRFTNNVPSARRLMLSALNIGRQAFTSPSFILQTPVDGVRYWWNVFRSVLFLESWFAFNTNHWSRITDKDLTLYQPPRSHDESRPSSLQEHVCELGQLGAYIALDLKAAVEPNAAHARVHLGSLNEWHRNLPPPMQLSRLSVADPFGVEGHMRRSLLQLHLLFLGIFTEPYRICLIDLGRSRLGHHTTDVEQLNTLKAVEEQCVLAARQSARVASLLQIERLIRPHCWVSIYTSFTSCSILLFSASQRLIEFTGEGVGQDLSYASSHLSLLSMCSHDNTVAGKLYTTLQLISNDIRETWVSPVYREMCDRHIAVRDAAPGATLHGTAIEGEDSANQMISGLTERTLYILQEAIVLREH